MSVIARASGGVRRHMRAHAEHYWAPALYALAVAWLYADIWSGERGFGWDTIESYWGDLAYLVRQLGRGAWPLWNPYDRGGYPFHADPQPGAYYPVQWLLAGLGVLLGGTSWWLIQIKMLLHHAIAGAAMHLYLRTRGAPRTAAVVAGLAWIGATPMLVHKASNVLWPLAWTPLIWVAIDRLTDAPGWRRAAGLAGAVYLAGAAGSPPGFFYTLLLGVSYGGLRAGQALWRAHRAHALAAQGARLALAVGLAAIVTLALLLVTVVPGLDLTEHTLRAQRGLDYALSLPLPVGETLIGLFHPGLGKHDAYPGIVALMLAGCGLAVRPLRDRGAPVLLAGSAVLFLCLSFGKATPLLPWLVEHVPGFGLFRIADRYKLAFAPLIAALAGHGAASLLEAPRAWSRQHITAVLVAVLGIAAVAALVWWREPPGGDAARPERAVLILAALATVLVLGACLLRRGAAIPVAILALLVLRDPVYFVRARDPVLEARPDPAAAQVLSGLAGIDTVWRIYDEFAVEQRPGSRLGVRDFRGYPSGDPLDLARYRDVLRYAEKRPEILEAYNVRYVLHAAHHRNRFRAHHLQVPPTRRAPAHFRALDGKRYEALHPAPLVAWYGGVRLAPDRKRALDLVRTSEDAEGRRSHAVVEAETLLALPAALRERIQGLASASAPPTAVAGELVRHGTDELIVRVHAPAPGLVVLNEVFYPGWQARVDGRPTPVVLANYLLRAVAVDAGTHEIVWTYAPPRQRALSLAWALGILTLLAAALGARLAAWRRGAGPIK